jgi:hypothetical protein
VWSKLWIQVVASASSDDVVAAMTRDGVAVEPDFCPGALP